MSSILSWAVGSGPGEDMTSVPTDLCRAAEWHWCGFQSAEMPSALAVTFPTLGLNPMLLLLAPLPGLKSFPNALS